MAVPTAVPTNVAEDFAQTFGITYPDFRRQWEGGGLPPGYVQSIESWLDGALAEASGAGSATLFGSGTPSSASTPSSPGSTGIADSRPTVEDPSEDSPSSSSSTSTSTSTSGSSSPSTSFLGDGSYGLNEVTVHSIPDDGELWSIDGEYAVAYQAGGKGGPWVYYMVPSENDINTYFPSGLPPARKMSQEKVDSLGGISPGSTNLLTNTLGENWEEGFEATMNREALTRPWLEDPEVLAVHLQAALEGRQVTEADLESTQWFSGRTDQEVTYAAFASTANGSELEQYHLQFKDVIRERLMDAGMRDPNVELVNFMAEKWSSGQWTDAYASRQIMSVVNPFSSIEMDAELQTLTESMELNTLAGQTRTVKDVVTKWLGPQHGASYSNEWYEQWAGAIMDDPNAENDLIDHLQGARMALYPTYENPNLTYEDIASPWQAQMEQTWGQSPANERQWGTLDRIIRANDIEEAGRILRTDGLRYGVEQVTDDANAKFRDGIGGQVVRSF